MIKQREANSWKSVSYAKSITGAQTYTKFPIVLRTTGQSIPTWSVKGNTKTSGTPSPSNPVDVIGVGVRTENLFDADMYYGTYKQADGTYQSTRANLYNVQIKPFTADDIGKTYTFVANISPITGNARLCANINGTIVSGSNTEKSVVTFTVETVDDLIFFNYGSGSTTVTTLSDIMLVEGSTAPTSYIPYGYKIPITSEGENLFDLSTWFTNVNATRCTKELLTTGVKITVTASDAYLGAAFRASDGTVPSGYRPQLIEVLQSTAYVLSVSSSPNCYISYITEDYGVINESFVKLPVSTTKVDYQFTTPANCKFICLRFGNDTLSIGDSYSFTDIMLNTGSTAKPYSPYNHTITPIYLGSVQSNRQIKKLVLTGEETWNNAGDGTMYRSDISDYLKEAIVTSVCTHYPCNANVPSSTAAQYGVSFITSSTYNRLYIKDTLYSTATDFKNWLATQYAAGTPVTVWYVLATPTTAAVNEPLMKIGTYADTLSNATPIPTTSGLNTIDVDTTVKPSEMSLTYDGYKICKHKRKSENLLDSSILDTPYNVTLTGMVYKDTQGLSRIANTTPIDVTNLTSVALTYNYSTQTTINFIYATLDANNNLIKREAGHTSGDSIDVSTAAKLNICFYNTNIALSINDISEVMLNSGSTALPYAPYWK
jgi:hypothetical protein